MYDHVNIDKKWQEIWKNKKAFRAANGGNKEKYYVLVEFPYPSGAGLHIGHPRSYTALDSLARKRRMQGYNVLFPIGFDAFGLPAENYAIKNKVSPAVAVEECIKIFKSQLLSLGISFDWDREIRTTDPAYYKWTQWQFLQFYKHGMAYKDKKTINWCTSCKVGLANEEVEGGKCERCGGDVIRKEKEQWMLKMRSYADKLIDGLEETSFVDRVKTAQINWIGKSVGAEITFKIDNESEELKVFTTRPDTLFGVTFMVISPEHPLLENLKDSIKNYDEVEAYKAASARKSEFERVELNKTKTGIKLDGINAINPITNKFIQVWISDYVMMGYGTGAIMAVPAHDERDYEFATKFNIPIIEVIRSSDGILPYTGDGIMINSSFLNGLDNKNDSISKMIEHLENNKIGTKTTNYRLQDWVFSRQRFWGEPIPMIKCEDCGWVPVKEDDLPVTLPEVEAYEPTDDGESPLANIEKWYAVPCPNCNKPAKRETDTMPNWAGSSWYYLRYMDPTFSSGIASDEAMNYWGMVDWYNGGMEHATRHLLYARFWHRFMYDIGLVPTKEPFLKRTAHGMILGENGEKMSKSRGNVVNPDDILSSYGADALRTYEMFIGDYKEDAIWSTNGLKGCKRFLDKLWRIKDQVSDSDKISKNLETIIHKTIKKVSEDIENMKYNTAIASLMTLLNAYDDEPITKADMKIFLVLLNPFAPHITEEINEQLKLGNPLYECDWPIYNPEKTIEEEFEMVIQVNGKLRAKVMINNDMSIEDMKAVALLQENVKANIAGKDIVKIIAVPKRLVNIVIK